eukprot:SAG22_NODE_1219_length_5132_cov_2.957878_4_plen_46_part_00
MIHDEIDHVIRQKDNVPKSPQDGRQMTAAAGARGGGGGGRRGRHG